MRYTDVNAVLPAKKILNFIAVICAVLFFANVGGAPGCCPASASALLVLSAILLGGICPAIVQQFQVKPTEPDKEAPYIEQNIEATARRPTASTTPRSATTPATADGERPAQAARPTPTPLPSVRLLDPHVVSPDLRAAAAGPRLLHVPDVLDVDRYTDRRQGAATRGRGCASSNLDGLPDSRQLDQRPHRLHPRLRRHRGLRQHDATTATAHAGLRRAGPARRAATLGKSYQPRIYFGETDPDYSIVGAPRATRELDYPDEGGETADEHATTGKGGVAVGNAVQPSCSTR